MILDQFWKIIFIILLGIGFSFWWKMKKSDKAHSFLIDELGELITTEIKSASANADKKAQESFYKSIEIIRQIEEIIGEDFEINQVISEAIETSDAPESFPRHEVADAFEINYIHARNFGLLDDDTAIARLEQGLKPVITQGNWIGETAVLGHFIVPSINDSLKYHIANRVLLPESINEMMQLEDYSRRVRNKADEFRRAKILDKGAFDKIVNTHKSPRFISQKS